MVWRHFLMRALPWPRAMPFLTKCTFEKCRIFSRPGNFDAPLGLWFSCKAGLGVNGVLIFTENFAKPSPATHLLFRFDWLFAFVLLMLISFIASAIFFVSSCTARLTAMASTPPQYFAASFCRVPHAILLLKIIMDIIVYCFSYISQIWRYIEDIRL